MGMMHKKWLWRLGSGHWRAAHIALVDEEWIEPLSTGIAGAFYPPCFLAPVLITHRK